MWVVMSVMGINSAHAIDARSFFNSREVISSNIRPFTKWTEMLSRYSNDEISHESGCGGVNQLPCRIVPWQQFLHGLQGKTKLEQIQQVNAYANQSPYITDPANWKKEDYWSTTKQFLIKNGDCEDYAIIKYFSLKRLGFKNEDMRIVILKDMNLKIMHAVLVVFDAGKTWVLDNQIKQVVEANNIYHYVPFYSINEEYWWRHRPL
jgi:predicted transglutaminase-like cysteine proteinase